MPVTQRLAKRTLSVAVTTSGQLVNAELELPSDMQSITGLALTGNRRDLMWQRGSVGVSINGEDLIAEFEPASEYIYGSSHPSRNFAFGELPLSSSDRRVRIRYQDTADGTSQFAAYTVQLVLTYAKRTNK